MRTRTEVNHNLSFAFLPSFAQYILTHKREDFRTSFQNELKHILSLKQNPLPIDPLFLLEHLANDRGTDFIQDIVGEWVKSFEDTADVFPVTAADVSGTALAIKKTLLNYITDFSRDTEQLIKILGDTDTFLHHLQTEATRVIFHLYEDAQKTAADYQHAAILTGTGNWKWDLKTNKVEWTDHLYRMYGMEPQSEEITLEKFLHFVHPEDRPAIEKTLRSRSAEDLLDLTFRIITRQGEERSVRSVAQQIVNEDGEVMAIIGTEQDVTERQQMLDDIRHSEALYKQAVNLAMIGSWSWDIEKNEVSWTDELYRIFGVERGQQPLNFELYTSLLHPEERDKVIKTILDAIHFVRPYEIVHRILWKDGSIRTIQSHGEVLTNKSGKPAKLVGTAQDVSERYNLIDKLQKSETLYKQAQALARIGNFNWNIKTNEVFWSDEIYNIYEIDPGTPVTFETAFEAILPADKPRVQKAIEESFASQEGKSISYAISVGERIKYIHLETELIADENGETTHFLGTAQDVTERQLLIEQLQESQRITQQAQSLAHIGNWVLDLKTNVFSWSEELYNIYEIPKDETVTVADWEKYIHPDERQEVITYFKELLHAKKAYEFTHRIQLPSGKTKTIFRKGEFVFDENSEAVKMIGTSQDITEQHRVQEALKANQEFIRKIADATPSIIASYNVNTGKYTFISEGLVKLLGYETSEVLEKGAGFFTDVIHPDDLGPLMEKNMNVLENANLPANRDKNLVEEFRYRMKHSNGNYRWFHTYGTIFDRNAEGKVEHVLNISLDITGQVEAEEKIVEQQFFIEQVADASPTILYLFDVPSNSFTYVNKEIFFILGYTTEEIVAMGDKVVQTIYHPEDLELLPERRESMKKFQLRNSMIQYECRMRTKDGDWNWILVREVVFKSTTEGQPLQILGAALDISKRKEIESELVQNSFKLQQSNSSLEEFAYVASHDLKEPLRKISTFGDRLMQTQSGKLGDDGKIYLNKIVDASQRMQIMINDLLSISMITGNRSFEPYSLQTILDDVKQTLEFKIDQKKAVIRSCDLPEASIVPSQFRQLFQNLLSNSLKFMKEDRQPVIEVLCEFLAEEEVAKYKLPKSDKYLKLQFVDNGIGFEEEYAGKIFQIFQRLHGRSEYEGTGIGLAICKKIVEHHGGIIYAEGRLNEGSTFTIILPA